MSCRRAFEVDLPLLLRVRAGEGWLAFREHYPRCPECAAEVRAWTDLLAALEHDGHPDPARLAALADAPGRLEPGDRRALERHVAACVSCRDEVATLRALAMPAAVAAAPARPVRPRRSWRERLAPIGAVVWHPAFAYALVVVVLAPVLATRLGERAGVPMAPPIDAARETAPAPPQAPLAAPAPPQAPLAASERGGGAGAADTGPLSAPYVAEPLSPHGLPTAPPAPATPTPPPRTVGAAEPEAKRAPAPPAADAAARRWDTAARAKGATQAPAPPPSQPPVRPEPQRAPGAAGELRDGGGQRQDAAPAVESRDAGAAMKSEVAKQRNLASQADVAAGVVALSPQRAARVDRAAAAAAPVWLDVPVPRDADVTVVVRTADGTRELHQRARSATGTVRIAVPAAWLAPGRYVVDVRGAAGATTTLALVVD